MVSTPEDRLKQRFIAAVSPYFHVKPEVEGKHLADGYRVYIDFLLYPLKSIRELQFDNWWFGVEVKHISDKDGIGKINQLFAQTITYQQCVYPGNKHEIRPIFTLIHTNKLSSNDERTMHMRRLLQLGQYLNIGYFDLTARSWKIGFGACSYFTCRMNNGIHELRRGNVANLGTKIYIGNATIGRDLTTERYIPE